MRDPDPKNPSLVPPPRGTDDVIKPKRITRSVSMDEKLTPMYTFSISKPAVGSGRKGSKKCSIKGRDLKKELYDMEYEDDVSSVARNVEKLEKWYANLRNVGSLDQGSGDRVNSVWPRLNEVNEKGSGSNGDGRNVGDIEMPDSTNGRKLLSFISDIQGMSSSGSNKLSRIPVKMNDMGENVVYIDPIIEKESKK
ncbi:hypothetical protein Tco_1484051 [Tanacetum coccineum]